MSVPQQASPQARTLSGTLAKTPMPRLLVSASSARVTGTLELTCEGGESATLTMVRGAVTKVKTSAPVAYLGSVLYELGSIDSDELNNSLRELSRTKWLHGEILLTRAAISPAQLAEGLHEQTTRKLVHLFGLPASTSYAFDTDTDRLATWGGSDWPLVDPFAAVWRGVRDGFANEEVDFVLSRAEKSAFRVANVVSAKRFDLTDVELAAVEHLRAGPCTIDELVGRVSLEPARVRGLLYFLLVTKQAEVIDTSGVHTAYRPPGARGAAPSTKPTVREMPATNPPPAARATSPAPAPTSGIDRAPRGADAPSSESSRWRAVAPIGRYASSSKIAIAAAHPAESGKIAIASPSNAPPSGAATRITMGGVPTARPSAPPASSSGGDRTARSTAPPSRPSTSSFSTKVVAELSARKLSIFERARSVLKEDHFQRLSLPRDAQPEQVEGAFLALRNLWDPDALPPGLEEAKDDCAFVLSCLVEAYTTLKSPRGRDEYVRQVSVAALRAPGDQIAEDLSASGSSDFYEGAQACFARGELDRAERLCRRAQKASPEAGAPLALLAWIEATKPSNQSPDETRKRIGMLDRALRLDEHLEQGYYWRGLLHKRIDNHNAAMSSFKRVVEMNPKHMDAVRELRVYEMRIRRNSLTMKAVR